MSYKKYDLKKVTNYIKENYKFRYNILTKKNQFYHEGEWFNYNNNVSKKIQKDLLSKGFDVPLLKIKTWCGTSDISINYDPSYDDLHDIIQYLRKHKDYTYGGKNEFSKKVRRLKEISISLNKTQKPL